jgi:hypothetical protein
MFQSLQDHHQEEYKYIKYLFIWVKQHVKLKLVLITNLMHNSFIL